MLAASDLTTLTNGVVLHRVNTGSSFRQDTSSRLTWRPRLAVLHFVSVFVAILITVVITLTHMHSLHRTSEEISELLAYLVSCPGLLFPDPLELRNTSL